MSRYEISWNETTTTFIVFIAFLAVVVFLVYLFGALLGTLLGTPVPCLETYEYCQRLTKHSDDLNECIKVTVARCDSKINKGNE
jgi:hypothetical protein